MSGLTRWLDCGRLMVLLTAAAVGSFGVETASAELISNGDFALGYAGWGQPGTPTVQYSTVVSSRNSSTAARVDLRTQADHGPRQNITAAVIAAGPGLVHGSSLWILLDQPASVRLLINLTDGAGFRQEILAERVVRQAGQWLEIVGSHRVTWTGTLTSAVVSVGIERYTEGVFPSLELDDVSIELDRDGDGVTDPEEALRGTDPLRTDSDDDGMEDGWEVTAGLDPSTDDAGLDPDGDHYVNRDELWAATDPFDPLSFPGRTSNPRAGDAAKNVLRYLALQPARDSCGLVGQHLAYPGPPTDEYVSYIDGLNAATGHYPAILALQYDDNANPVQVATVNPFAIRWWNAGGLVQIKWNPLNPWTGLHYGDRTFNGFAEVITPGFAAYDTFLAQLQMVGDGLDELRRNGVVVLWRPFSEMNGAWFWWGRRDQQGYVDFVRFSWDYLTRVRGLDNLLFVYESDSGVHGALPVDYYYPGDDLIDVLSHNLYEDNWALPFASQAVLRPYGKVAAVPQAGPATVKDGTWSNLIYLDGDPPGAGGIRNLYPRTSYFAAWNSFWTWDPVLMTSVYKNMAIVDNAEALELMTEPCVVTRDEIDASCPLPSRVPVLLLVEAGGGLLRASWGDVALASDYVLLEDPAANGRFESFTGAAPTGMVGIGFPPPSGSMNYRLAGRNGCGLGSID